MASFTWNGKTFDGPSSIIRNEINFGEIRFSYPGVAGVEIIDMDGKTRVIEIVGVHSEASLAEMVEFFDGIDDDRKVVAPLSIYDGAKLYQNVKCRTFRGRLYATPDGFNQEFKAVFVEVQPVEEV